MLTKEKRLIWNQQWRQKEEEERIKERDLMYAALSRSLSLSRLLPAVVHHGSYEHHLLNITATVAWLPALSLYLSVALSCFFLSLPLFNVFFCHLSPFLSPLISLSLSLHARLRSLWLTHVIRQEEGDTSFTPLMIKPSAERAEGKGGMRGS